MKVKKKGECHASTPPSFILCRHWYSVHTWFMLPLACRSVHASPTSPAEHQRLAITIRQSSLGKLGISLVVGKQGGLHDLAFKSLCQLACLLAIHFGSPCWRSPRWRKPSARPRQRWGCPPWSKPPHYCRCSARDKPGESAPCRSRDCNCNIILICLVF